MFDLAFLTPDILGSSWHCSVGPIGQVSTRTWRILVTQGALKRSKNSNSLHRMVARALD
jgi:hypothetical protein